MCRSCISAKLGERASGRPTNIEPGQRFGELVVLYELPKGKRTHGTGQGREWMCVCDCGGHAIRTTGQLNRPFQADGGPCCASCLQELRGGSGWKRRADRIDHYRTLWHFTGLLYSEDAIEGITNDIRDDVATDLGFYPEPAWKETVYAHRCDETPPKAVPRRPTASEHGTPSIVRWIKWQQAVDFAMENWAIGLTRVKVERMLYKTYMKER